MAGTRDNAADWLEVAARNGHRFERLLQADAADIRRLQSHCPGSDEGLSRIERLQHSVNTVLNQLQRPET